MEKLNASSRRTPCPICGRTKDGDCRISDELVLCHYGSTKHPPQQLKPGQVIPGDDGQEWAFTGDAKDGRTAAYIRHKPRPTSHQAPVQTRQSQPPTPQLARLESPAKEPPAHMPKGLRINYSSTQWVEIVRNGNEKKHIPHHQDDEGRAQRGAGDEPWPLWRQDDAITHGVGMWIAEAEGEKCGAWFRAGGVVAISQPGHDHKPASIERRYRTLVEAGVAGVLYLADNDETGRKKAERCAAAAATVGLPLLVLHASDVWSDMPVGGSIDDAPGTAAERVAAVVAAIPAAINRQPEVGHAQAESLTTAQAADRLRDAISDGITESELSVLVTDLASETGQTHYAIKQIADTITREQRSAAAIRAEAAGLVSEIDRQDIGRVLTAPYLLPGSIASAIEIRSRYLPTDGPSGVLPFLAAVAGLVKLGTEVEASAAAGYRVPINLFACLVGRSGAKKSPTGRLLVEQPTLELRREMARDNQRANDNWREQCKGTKKTEWPEPPQPRQLHVSEATSEALAHQLQTQEDFGLGLLINRDELSGLFAGFNQYKGGRGGDEQQLLELFDGGGLTSLRVSGGRSYSRSQVSIYGGLQREILEELVAKGDASGLWARFMFVPLPERVVPLPLEATAEEDAEVEHATATLAEVCRVIYKRPRATYRLTKAAAERFREYERNRQHWALRATISAQSAVYGKSAGKVLRVAGLFHLLQIAAGESADPEKIDESCIDRAGSLVDHLDAWALSLHAEVAAGGGGSLMRTVHNAAEAAKESINWRSMLQRLSKKQRDRVDVAAFKEAAEALASAGYGELERGPRGSVSYRSTKPLP